VETLLIAGWLGQLRSGNDRAIERIIEYFIPTALGISKYYERHYPSHAEGIRSTAYFTLCTCVNEANEKLYNDDIAAYIGFMVKRKIKSFIANDRVVRIPYVKFLKMLEGADSMASIAPIMTPMNTCEDPEDDACTFEIGKVFYREGDLEDILNEMHLKKKEIEVAHLLLHGFTQTEIAEQLGCTQQNVQLIHKSIKNKFKKAQK
jgi:RNA polymerase sigma factor (sigma-70 family)